MTTENWQGPCCAALLAALLAGCAATEPKAPPRKVVNQSGYSETFRQGYAEGCDSAGSRSPRRNETRYKTEADYMMGWNDGYSACRKGR
jgi:hypothetical protein